MAVQSDTIFAVATAPGKAGVAIIRLSGNRARVAVESLAGSVGPARYMALRKLRRNDEVLDEALVVWFEKEASFTGEECAELHLHGGRAVVNGVIEALAEMDSLRAAEAGEFTRRALDNDRLDLTQVEGLADLIDAQTEAQRRLAMAVAEGRLSEVVKSIRRDAIHALALIEASLDFADEDDAPVDVSSEVAMTLSRMLAELQRLTDGAREAEALRSGYRVAIVGVPNVGKSSLLNAIAGREVAITSNVAGTTRDVIEVQCDVRGLPVTFVDTAGLRPTDDEVETIGVERALEAASGADLRLLLETNGAAIPGEVPVREDDIRVWSMVDLHPSVTDLAVSAVSGEGLETLLATVYDALSQRASGLSLTAHARQVSRFEVAQSALRASLQGQNLELISFEIRHALKALDEVLGLVDTDTVLAEIFSRFCMGK
ncbi:MAG: tRNA uridine-5-carboxymethylaminomethyl(34) synthesis GTPase MnmE [Pseudomonadota bacterium]